MTTTSQSRSPSGLPNKLLLGAAVAVAAVAIVVVALLLLGGDDGGAEVRVYPDQRTLAASPDTTVSFRGVGRSELDAVTVDGSRSGRHAGRWTSHPDGGGATFTPAEPFTPGERVTVATGLPVAGAGGEDSSFTIARTVTAPSPPLDKAKPVATTAGVRSFRSRPELHPPAVAVETATAGATPGYVFVGPKRGESQQGPLILDSDGEPVWFRPLRNDRQAFGFRTQTYRDRPVLTWWEGGVATYRGDGVGKILDTSYRDVATVRAGNGYEFDLHEFELTPRGTALLISYETVPWDLSKLGGRRDGLLEDNIVQEIDVASGAVLFEWHALGNIPLGDSIRPAPKELNKRHDPFHLNSVELQPNGDLLLSARHTNAVYEVDTETGQVSWRLGGKRSSFEMGEGVRFSLQHDARRQPDGTLTLFDNVAEDLPARGRQSRGLQIALDEEEMTAALVREYEHPDKLLSTTQASMQALDGGGAFIGWGGLQPVFSEFDAEGGLVFDARFLAKGVESYRAHRSPWKARAPGRPAVELRATGTGSTVWVSWNGATEVRRWRVRPAGGAVREAPREGFETEIRLQGQPGSVIVEALGPSGRVLGRSARVAAG